MSTITQQLTQEHALDWSGKLKTAFLSVDCGCFCSSPVHLSSSTMGHRPMSRRAALVLLAIGGTNFTDIAAALKGSGGSAATACTLDSASLEFTAQLNVAVNFRCPAGSQFKPPEAAGGTSAVALNGTTCSENVSFSELGLLATLSSPSGSKIGDDVQAATQYAFAVTKLPTAEKLLCYICEMPSSKNPSETNRALREGGASGSSPTTPCQVRIRVPADPSSPSTPAPSSSSTPAPSVSAPRPSIGTFLGAVSAFLGLVKTHLL